MALGDELMVPPEPGGRGAGGTGYGAGSDGGLGRLIARMQSRIDDLEANAGRGARTAPIPLVATLPSSAPVGRLAILSSDGKLYRGNGADRKSVV